MTVAKNPNNVIRLYSYNPHSAGSKELADRMGIRRIKFEGSKFVGGADKTIINWGASTIPTFATKNGTRIINPPELVASMTNKEHTFGLLSDQCRMPPYTNDLGRARQWLRDGYTVFARTTLNGHSGAGIVIMDPEHPDTHDVRARLYVRYVKKKDEFRVHVCDGRVIDVQRKGLRTELEGRDDVDHRIRNLANGFVFVRNGVQVPEDVTTQSLAAIRASGLHFGAVDVIYNVKEGNAYVLEVNTAPGLQGQTIESYATALNALLGK